MTKQSSETIEYKGQKYQLFSDPLRSYLEKKKIKMGSAASCAWRGYVGTWELDENGLFLAALELCNESLYTLFGSDAPVFATWFSGTLKIAVGEMIDVGWPGEDTYDYYLWVKIDKGYVCEKRIIQHFGNNPIINFGKHNGLPLSSIMEGDVNFMGDLPFFCKTYIKKLLEFFCLREFNESIQIPQFEQTGDLIKMADLSKFRDKEFLVTKEFVAIENFSKGWAQNEGEAVQFSVSIERLLLEDFNTLTDARRADCRLENIEGGINLINPDFDYLDWAITEVEGFCVPPHLFLKHRILNHLETFKTNRLSETIFEYTPVVTRVRYDLKTETKMINLQKFVKKHQVKYDSLNNIYVPYFSINKKAAKFKSLLD